MLMRQEDQMTRPVRITVMKRALHTDLLGPPLTEKTVHGITRCRDFKDGQEFIIDGPLPVKPEGFCDGAWCDIQKHLYIVAFGGTHASTEPPGICFACCTDGLRPVTFRIEPVED
jgi:uncharacterized repeat protein (TIGR04076 family)